MKTALVTGASGGIGRAVAQKLYKDGYFIIAQYNNNIDGIKLLEKDLNQQKAQEQQLDQEIAALQEDKSSSGQTIEQTAEATQAQGVDAEDFERLKKERYEASKKTVERTFGNKDGDGMEA